MNLVIGKFYPPHEGHHYVIEQALADGLTTVLVLWSERESISVYDRVPWLQDAHPMATVLGAQDEHSVDYDDDAAWGNHMSVIHKALLWSRAQWPIEGVYGSEPYIKRLAAECTYLNLGNGYGSVVRPEIVDIPRLRWPISGTALRANLAAHWDYLRPAARAGLCKRIVCIGAESCGTTTLARDLAAYYDTVWVPEYGRTYSEGLRDGPWTHEALAHIASAQRRLENSLARSSRHGLLICDTNTLATAVWDEFLVGDDSDIQPSPADLYLLTDFCPWEDDGTRSGEDYRLEMQSAFLDRLAELPFHGVSGTRRQRLAQAVAYIDNVLHWTFNDPLG